VSHLNTLNGLVDLTLKNKSQRNVNNMKVGF